MSFLLMSHSIENSRNNNQGKNRQTNPANERLIHGKADIHTLQGNLTNEEIPDVKVEVNTSGTQTNGSTADYTRNWTNIAPKEKQNPLISTLIDIEKTNRNVPINTSNTVVVAVDGSKTSNEAFRAAVAQTTPKDKLIIYHGEYLATALEGDGQFTTVSDPTNERNTLYLRDFFLDQCKRYDRSCDFVSHKLHGGASVVGRDVCEVARRNRARNIFLGSRGLSFPTRLFLGSVSWNCLNYCDCSVTVVKDPKSFNERNQSIIPDSWTDNTHLPTDFQE